MKEVKEVFEGELTSLTPVEAENALAGYGKTISHGKNTLESCGRGCFFLIVRNDDTR